MATDEVRYVGEAVAVVIARDRYTAADAVAAVDVNYEPLPPVLDMRTALDESSPQVHEAGNKCYVWPFVQGDMDAAFRDAPVVVERTYRQQRLIPCAMEPRAVVASYVANEVTLWSATQIPHVLRFALGAFFGIPEQNIRVIAPDVGGGFGSKLQVTAEEVLAVLVARKLGRPVKWTESRSEGNLTVHHGRDQWQTIRVAADRDGRLRGLDDDLLAEQQARRESGDPVQLGIGISTFTEMCGLAPSRVVGSLRYGVGGWENATVRVLPTGKVEVVTGSSAHGQGHETAWSQI